jgi:hypothetical protein
MEDEEVSWDNIRDIIGYLVGRKVVDITQTDMDDVRRGEPDEVEILFDDGSTLAFPAGVGFRWTDGRE